jgi:hypothetical protein
MSIIRMKASDNEDIYIEVKDLLDADYEAPVEAGGVTAGVEETISRFERVGQEVIRICKDVYGKYEAADATFRPDEFTLQFGVKLAGKVGIPFVTEGSAEGTFQVTAKWTKHA